MLVQRTDGSINVVALGTDSIAVSESVRSLGVTIDSTLSFNTHVNNVCKSVRYHTRALRHVRKCVSIDDAKQIAAAMVSARLDYCNSILYKTSMSNISKLQRLQNSLARVVSGARKRDHITPILADLHWLPINARIDYKLALITFKSLVLQQPSYLHELLTVAHSSRSLRSSTQVNRLQTTCSRTSFGSRAFCCSAPAVWNSLPLELTNNLSSLPVFKRDLKTYLYRRSFKL
jgi:hypothetical protein